MNRLEQAFRLLPDVVVITDAYWYVLDYNRMPPFENFRKGKSLVRYMPDCKDLPHDQYRCADRIYQRSISPVYEDQICVGYVAYLADITEKEQLIKLRREKSEELKALTHKQQQANRKLEDYARQIKALSDYEEQKNIARAIHDDAGHAITELNTISRMCLQLRGSDPQQYKRLIEQGIAICRRALKGMSADPDASLEQKLERFRASCPFPVELEMTGEEPPFAAGLRDVIMRICKEAYHNTTAHSMADKLRIQVQMTPEEMILHITDNGHFHGPLEKGFGLTAMEEAVHLCGGTLSFETQEGSGFGILVKWRADS